MHSSDWLIAFHSLSRNSTAESYIDDDVVTFMLLGQTDSQLCIVHQSHIVLQHLWNGTVLVICHRLDSNRLHPFTCVGAEFFCRMSTTRWKLSGDFLRVKPSQFLLVKRASTSDHASIFARAASAVTKYCFSEI